MKKIEAIIKPYKLEQVKEALCNIGITGMTVSHAEGFGKQKGHLEFYRGQEFDVVFIEKLKIEIIVTNEMLDKTIDTIIENAKTDEIGDGKIFVYDVQKVIKIRTGETDENAI